MANYSRLFITDIGKEMLTKMIETGRAINFTEIKSSNASYQLEDLESLTELADIQQSSMISSKEIIDGKIRIESSFNNSTISSGYYMRALGLYAEDSDGEEILYAVTVETSGNCYLPPYNGNTVSGVNVSFIISVDNAENVSLEVNPAALATIKDIQKVKEEIDSIISDNMEQAFYSVFTKVEEQEDETPLSEADIKTAISTPWDGQSSYDITAMSKDDINNAIHTPWDGKSSTDETALSSADIKKATTL